MKIFTYNKTLITMATLEDDLNELGKEGWEVIYIKLGYLQAETLLVVLKREVNRVVRKTLPVLQTHPSDAAPVELL